MQAFYASLSVTYLYLSLVHGQIQCFIGSTSSFDENVTFSGNETCQKNEICTKFSATFSSEILRSCKYNQNLNCTGDVSPIES